MKLCLSFVAMVLSTPLCAAIGQSIDSLPARLAPIAASAPTPVPALVPYSGLALGGDRKPLSGESTITFQVFKDEQGGEPIFTESQVVLIDAAGHYRVQLGASLASGIPSSVFASGEARWLEIQIAGQGQQARMLLASVPYALRAADSATLGGFPASAFVLARPSLATGKGGVLPSVATPAAVANVTTTGGTSGYLPRYSGANTVINSEIFDTGTSVGIGVTPSASARLDVLGASILRGKVDLSRSGNATAAAGFPSYGLSLSANAWNSSTATSVNPYFSLQSEPAGNNTTAPSATLNLRYSANGTSEAETGFSINPNGIVHFAAGQTFAGVGTLTGVTAGTGLTGGGTTGTVTLNVDATKVPTLAGANTFTTTQTIKTGNLNLPATTSATNGVLSIGGVPFLHGYTATKGSVFVGGAGNFSTTGLSTTAVGLSALHAQTIGSYNAAFGWLAGSRLTTGSSNTALGDQALSNSVAGIAGVAVGYRAAANDTGAGINTAVGAAALSNPMTGSENTGLGYLANIGANSAGISNATAIGAESVVSQSNSLILGKTVEGAPGAAFVNVGVGTSQPRSVLEASVSAPSAIGPVLTLTNTAGGPGAAAALDFNSYQVAGSAYNPTARIEAIDDGQGSNNLYFLSNLQGGHNLGLRQNMAVNSNGSVNIGPANTNAQLTVQATGGWDAVEGIGTMDSNGDGTAGIYGVGGDSASNSRSGQAAPGGTFQGGHGDGNADGGDGIFAQGGNSDYDLGGFAGNFQGSVFVSGVLYASAKNFQIDHPLDPANRYLVHTAVESSEMMNIYSGNVVTDDSGKATVTLPDWFESENGDFRYQLTVVGQFAQAIVGQKIENHHFSISTNAQHVEVSWQVTAVRHDAYAKAHPLIVDQAKPVIEQGFYIHPELFGQPQEKQREWARHADRMRQLSDRRTASTRTTPPVRPAMGPAASAVGRRFAPAALPVLQSSLQKP